MEGAIEPGDIGILEPGTRSAKEGDPGENTPVEGLWGDGLETVALLPPGAPGGVFETDAISNLVLETGHVAPGAPDVFLAPFVGEVVDLAAGEV